MNTKLKYIAAAVIAIAGLALQQVKADTFSSDLTIGNSALSGFNGPFANVLVTLTSPTTATVTFTSLTNSGNIYLFGANDAVDVNVNATSWTISGITGTNAGTGFSPGPFTEHQNEASSVDGFGRINQTIDSFDGFGHSSDQVSFTLTNTSGVWASAATVLTPNSSGFDAAAHIFVTSSPANASGTVLATGYAAEVPEPSTALLLGGGLLSFFVRFRARR